MAGSLNALEYDCTFSNTFLKSSTLNVNGISSSSYKSSNTWPLPKLDIVPDGFCVDSFTDIVFMKVTPMVQTQLYHYLMML